MPSPPAPAAEAGSAAACRDGWRVDVHRLGEGGEAQRPQQRLPIRLEQRQLPEPPCGCRLRWLGCGFGLRSGGHAAPPSPPTAAPRAAALRARGPGAGEAAETSPHRRRHPPPTPLSWGGEGRAAAACGGQTTRRAGERRQAQRSHLFSCYRRCSAYWHLLRRGGYCWPGFLRLSRMSCARTTVLEHRPEAKFGVSQILPLLTYLARPAKTRSKARLAAAWRPHIG